MSLHRRRQTEAFHAKLQQRKELYEEVYNEVREGCELTASSEVLEALQREAQQVRARFNYFMSLLCLLCEMRLLNE